MNLPMKTFWYQLLCFFFQFHCLFSSSQISHSSTTLFTFTVLSLFGFFFFFFPPLLFYASSLLIFFFLLFVSAILVFSALLSTTSHTLLDISSFLIPLFSNQSWGYSMLAMASPKSHSTSVPQLY